jgi:hypothetical protein
LEANCGIPLKLFLLFSRQYEQAGFLANDNKNYTLVAESFEKSAELMISSGTRDSAGIMLERGAKY